MTPDSPDTQPSLADTDTPNLTNPVTKADWLAVLNQLGVEGFNKARRDTEFDLVDISQTDFTGLNLSGINLSQVNAMDCVFDFCDMSEATMVYTRFNRSSMREARLFMVNAPESDFSGCDLYQAVLSGGDFSTSLFRACNAKEAQFNDAQLDGVQFQGSYLNDAVFTGADLSYANFEQADMEWAILTGVKYNQHTHWGNQKPPEASVDS